MASKRFVGAIAILAFVLPAVAMATEFTVGDDQGWTINFNYEAWSKDKVFQVGDELFFKYRAGWHNVFKVNGTTFTNYTMPLANEALTTGNGVITLAIPGRKWYICGVNNHCANYGQKLAITVLEASASPAPAPSIPTAPASSSAHGIFGSGNEVRGKACVEKYCLKDAEQAYIQTTPLWYICGVNDHCANYGQKLAITVLEAWVSPASAPPPPQHQLPPPPQPPSTPAAPAPSSAYGISVSGYQLLMAAMVAVAFLVV
ncbi:hypothetical protein AAG906_031341 [Vitis piasezkii]